MIIYKYSCNAAKFKQKFGYDGRITMTRFDEGAQVETLIKRRRWREALVLLRRARKRDPDTFILRYRFGTCYEGLGYRKLARRAYLTAADGPSVSRTDRGRLIQSFTRIGCFRDAIDQVARLTEDDPQAVELLIGVLEAARERGREAWDLACSYVIGIIPGTVRLCSLMRFHCSDVGAWSWALLFGRALNARCEERGTHYCLGRELAMCGEIGEALLEYSRAITNAPDDWLLYWELGDVLAANGQEEEAFRTYELALKWLGHDQSDEAVQLTLRAAFVAAAQGLNSQADALVAHAKLLGVKTDWDYQLVIDLVPLSSPGNTWRLAEALLTFRAG